MKLMTSFVAVAAAAALVPTAAAAQSQSPQVSLSQCVALKTSGADRMLTARWLFAVMAESPQIADLAAVTPQRKVELDKAFAKLVVRIVNQDCIDQVRPLAAENLQNAFEQVGRSLGETAMGELLGAKEVDKGVAAYADYLTEEDFKPLMDSIPKRQSK